MTYDPDILAEGLDVVFCGINPATTAVAAGHSFSGDSNRFWRVLHRAGFTDQQLRPEDERQILSYGCGITAAVPRATKRGEDISVAEFQRARPVFEAKMRRYHPRMIAFLGKRALSAMSGLQKLEWGSQPMAFAGSAAWVLPNPSGRNRGYSLEDLVEAYGRLHNALHQSPVT